MPNKKVDLDIIDKIGESAPMEEKNNVDSTMKKKLIEYPEDWGIKFKDAYGKMSIASYIVQGFREKLKKDGIL